jgi:hypothetical protein
LATSSLSPALPDNSGFHIPNGMNAHVDNSGVVDHPFHRLNFL